MKKLRYTYQLPKVNGIFILLGPGRLEEALVLMRQGKIEPEEVNQYLVAEWN